MTGTAAMTSPNGTLTTITTTSPNGTLTAITTASQSPTNSTVTYTVTLTGLDSISFSTTAADLTLTASIASYEAAVPAPALWTLTTPNRYIFLAETPIFQFNFSSQSDFVYPTQITLVATYIHSDTPATQGTTDSVSSSLANGISSAITVSSTIIVTSSQLPSPLTASPTSATAATPSQSSSASSNVSTQPTLSIGTKVGIALGSVLAVLLVASVLVLICLKRHKRHKRLSQPPRDISCAQKINGESSKLAAVTVTSRPMHIPQPESDQTITRLANRTLDDIELFIENYYIDQPRKLVGDINAPTTVPFNSPYLGRPAADVIRSSSEAINILKHCVAYYLLQKIDPSHSSTLNLLPRHFVTPAEGGPKAISQRRVAIAHARPDSDRDEDYLRQCDRATQTIIQQIEHAFQPWARGNAEQRARNLRGILTHLSELGRTLFAQPAEFEWRWHTLSREQLVIVPGLDKVTDSEAVLLATPICLVQPQLGTIQ